MTAVSMRPLDVLRDEHRLILRFLDQVEAAVDSLVADQRPPPEFFEKALAFAESFANVFHHIKEEEIMFARFAAKKNGAIGSQVDLLLHQHDRARGYLEAVRNALSGYSVGESIPTSSVLENMAAYVVLLRNHIHREDCFLYPLVEESLSPEEEQQLHEAFEQERKKAGREVFRINEILISEMGDLLKGVR